MNLSDLQPDRNAERVCTHKCALHTARMISLGAHCLENTTLYFSRSDAMTLAKYNRHIAHHA